MIDRAVDQRALLFLACLVALAPARVAADGSDLLELRADTSSDVSGQLIEGQLGNNIVFRVWNDGDVTADGTSAPGAADFAERVASTQGLVDFEPGDVLVIDPNATRGFRKSADARSPRAAGVYSTKPGVLASERDWDSMERQVPGGESVARKTIDHARDYDEFPLAIVGIVPCKVSAENGPVRAGDLLVSSGTPGHAMRAEDPRAGTIVGKALEGMKGSADTVKILVTLQ